MYAIIRVDSFDEVIISKHRTKEVADKTLCKKYGHSYMLSSNKYRVRNLDQYDIVEIFGKKVLRPKV